MYRINCSKPERIDFNMILDTGGAGDMIASMPVVRYITENYTQNHSFIFWYPDYFVDLAKFVFPKVRIRSLSDIHKRNSKLPTFHTRVEFPSFLRQNLTDFASLLLSDIILQPNEKNYLKPDLSVYGLPKHLKEALKGIEKYIIITSMYTSPVRAFRGKEINKISKWCNENGYTPVFMGKEKAEAKLIGQDFITANADEDIDFTLGINLINKTSLIDALKICEKASAVIGLDNGLLHLACMTDVMVIGGFTTVRPEHRLPYRHDVMGWNFYSVVPDDDLGCKFCQSNWGYDIKQDFMHCFYLDRKLDNTIRCCDQITGEKFIHILEETLNV